MKRKTPKKKKIARVVIGRPGSRMCDLTTTNPELAGPIDRIVKVIKSFRWESQ